MERGGPHFGAHPLFGWPVAQPAQFTVRPAALPVPWKPNSVAPPAGSEPFQTALENSTAPDVPFATELHELLTAAPGGRAAVTVHPFSGAVPAVTRTVATNPPVHWFTVTIAEHVPLGGGVVGGGVVGGGVLPLPVHEAVGNAVLPFLYSVIPKSLPEPFGLAVSVPDVPVTFAFHEFCSV